MERRRIPVWQILLAVGLGVWTVGVMVLAQVALYALETLATLVRGESGSDATQVAAGVIAAVLVLVPAALVATLPVAGGVRAFGQALAWAGAASGLLAAARLAPLPDHEGYLLGLAAAAGLASLLQLWSARRAGAERAERRRGPGWAALAGGLLMLVPWAWLGALGGLLETVLAGVAAAAVGWLAAVTTAGVGAARSGGGGRVFVAGLGAGVVLVPLAGATGETGVALAELGVLPPLGFAVAVLRRGAGVLVGLAAAGPLAFVDPEETSLILGTSDVAFWTLVAAASAFLVAVLLATGYALAARDRRRSGGLAVAALASSDPPDGSAPDHTTPDGSAPDHTAPDAGPGVGRIRRSLAGGLALVLALGVVAVNAGPGQPGLHGDRLFVVLAQQADLTGLDAIPDRAERLRQTYRRLVDHAERTQAALRSDLRRFRIGFRPFYLVNGLEIDAGPALRPWLTRRSDVDSVLTNPVLRPLPAEQSPLRGRPEPTDGPLWNIRMVRADQVWEAAGARGAGIVIGTSDSGVDGTHPAVESAFRGGDDSWYDPWNATTGPTDHNGHGTHTLGTALGRGGIGVAPDASWIGCVNLDRNLGNPAHYLDCLQFMLAPFPAAGDPLRDGRPERAAHVLTNSWGCPELEGCERGTLHPAIAALTAAGIFVVAAAGNTGDAGCGSITDEPAIDPEALTVGAVSQTGAVPSFSSRGPVAGAVKPDVMAPGTQIESAVPGGGYRAESGTSMATPHVAGVVALMWSANPRLIGNVSRTADILRSTARVAALTASPNDCGDPRNIRGAGLVDALAAVTAARAIGP